MSSSPHEWFVLAVFVLLCFAAARVGSFLTTPALDGWYAALRKPSWNPPNWIFGPVWSVLYLSMAIAAWLVWRRCEWSKASLPLSLFALQLVLNVVWSGLFFALKNPKAAFVEILLLWGAILATLIAFWRVTSLAGWLLVPYFGWVAYAAVLNFSIWQMNKRIFSEKW